jgi:Arrestin (or S-antigen), N-terminal domain
MRVILLRPPSRISPACHARGPTLIRFLINSFSFVPHSDAGPGGNGINHWDVVASGGGDASAYDNNLSPSGQSVMSSGEHRFPFGFQLPEGRLLPGSFESRHGTVRYYVRVLIDVPYASPLQGLKYFTVVGPLIDRLDSRYNVRMHAYVST